MKKEGLITVVFFIVFISLAALTLYIIQGYINALLAAAVLAYIFHPVYAWLSKKTGLKSLSSLLVCVLILVVLLVPVIFVVDNAANEARFAYIRTMQIITTGKIIDGDCVPAGSATCQLLSDVGAYVSEPQVQVYLQDALSKTTNFVITKVTDMLLALPSVLLNVLIVFFATYYLLKEGPAIVHWFKNLLPVGRKHKEHIIRQLGDVTYGLVYGSLVVAIIEGVLGGIAFWLVGISSPVLWGAMMAILAVIPFVGAGIIWAPAGIYLLFIGLTQGNTVLIAKGMGLLIFGLLFISTIDTIIKPRIIGDRTGINPVLVLVGVLGGLATFGIVGFIIGPLIIAVLKSIITIYETEVSHA